MFLKQISPIINDYMEENSINVLLDSKNIFIGSKASNLTKDILKEINKKLK
jgi:Skp family chaperone for outer membrane proteins